MKKPNRKPSLRPLQTAALALVTGGVISPRDSASGMPSACAQAPRDGVSGDATG